MTDKSIKSAAEALLFVWGDPLEAKTAADLFNISTQEMLRLFRELSDEYAERGSGLTIREINKSFQLCTAAENDDYIRKLCTPVKEKRLTQPALEVLAVIAYKQPVTKAAIDSIRGIKSDRVLESLLKRGLVEERGRSAAIGRPILYGTTDEFLKQFGFENLSDLPELDDVESLMLSEEEEQLRSGQLTLPLEDEVSSEKPE